MKPIFALLPLALLTLTACENNKGPISPDFGNSVHHNMSVHIINPRSPNPSAAAPGMSGARSVGVMKRYMEGATKELEIEKTSGK
jgi:hypothetical protein